MNQIQVIPLTPVDYSFKMELAGLHVLPGNGSSFFFTAFRAAFPPDGVAPLKEMAHMA